MRHILPLAPVLLCLAACQSNPSATEAGLAVPEPIEREQAKVESANPEHIEFSMLTVNGEAQDELTTNLLQRQLGRPDSIAKGAIECGGVLQNLNGPNITNGDWWYYGKTMYEVSGTQAILHSFDVTSGKFQGKLGKLVLDQHTTLEDVRRFYPVSAKDADLPATGRPEQQMSLPFFYHGQPTDASLTLLFRKGRLQEVEFFFPC